MNHQLQRRTVLTALGLALPALALARPQSPEAAPSGPPMMMRPTMPKSMGKGFKLALDTSYPMPVVIVHIGKSRPLKFSIDTGTPMEGLIAPHAAKELGLTVVGEVMAGDPSGKNLQKALLYGVPSLKIGDLSYSGLTLGENLLAMPFKEPLDGILGMSLFMGMVLTFDRVHNQLRCVRGALPKANNKTIFQSPDGPLLQVDLMIGQETFVTHIDTGQSRAALIVPSQDLKRIKLNGPAKSIGKARTISQEIEVFGAPLAEKVKLGQITFDVDTVVYPSPTPHVNLGWAGLKGRSLSVDISHSRIKIA